MRVLVGFFKKNQVGWAPMNSPSFSRWTCQELIKPSKLTSESCTSQSLWNSARSCLLGEAEDPTLDVSSSDGRHMETTWSWMQVQCKLANGGSELLLWNKRAAHHMTHRPHLLKSSNLV